MPELPEVETTVRNLRKSIVGRRIKGAFSDTPQIFEDKRLLRTIGSELKGDSITSVDRHGKYLIFNLKSSRILLAHMKMTGHFLFVTTPRPKLTKSKPTESQIPPVSIVYTIDTGGANAGTVNEREVGERFVRFSIEFFDGARLLFSDVRKFGRIWLLDNGGRAEFFAKRKLGHDAMSPKCTEKYLASQLKRNRAIKSLLLDQTCIAGIGNIYADESLWQAKIHPMRKSSSLKEAEIRSIWAAIRAILKKGIRAGGTSIRDYRKPDGSLGYFQTLRAVYQKTGEPCRRCGTKIKRIVVAQRSTHFCPKCQRLTINK